MKKDDIDRAIWRSRRGLLELDLLLYPFACHRYSELTFKAKEKYHELLHCEDVDILAWLKNESECPEEFQLLKQLILEYAANENPE